MLSSDAISEKLGEYMLKGWILTDKTCPNAGCSCILMRSPAAVTPTVHFCVNCDGTPESSGSRLNPQSQTSQSASSASSSSHTMTSTAPTELEEVSDNEDFQLPPETEAMRRRREQSDHASAEIGARLLKGWAMLGEECPNEDCFAVPLVRPPSNLQGQKDPRMASELFLLFPHCECVVCGRIYMLEKNIIGQDSIVEALPSVDVGQSTVTTSSSHALPQRGRPESSAAAVVTLSAPILPNTLPTSLAISPKTSAPATSTAAALSSRATSAPIQALELSLHTLSAQLTAQCGGVAEPRTIAMIAEAIGKVTQALSEIKQYEWNERNAASME
ncbi:hypothetical protein FISHEDRAFT_36815 [Fistulina hepatica ATCC 64428]|uniref:Uncharacterized protein n=1 Tax=Fistulina hepatica ATCC 64428 TaxID=1128425 RepID=A0A0D7AJV9_9AGAR|nr:hypothetical protein FISHEDRAFT_36815 [Fistulina hepatica ATCC 64428]